VSGWCEASHASNAGIKSFEPTQYTLVGVELIHTMKGQRVGEEGAEGLTLAVQFYALAV